MKIPTIKIARDLWNITKLEVNRHDANIQILQSYLQPSYTQILKDIRNKNYLIGLQDYKFSSNDEIYAMHMMLINNKNIILENEKGHAKYHYVNERAKEGLGIKAYGFTFLDMDLARTIRKMYLIHNDNVFKDLCFILNYLLGIACNNQSAYSNKNIINLFTLANNLFMNLDQVLIALSFLKQSKLVNFNRNAADHEFKFSFNNLLTTAIENKIHQIQNDNINFQEDKVVIEPVKDTTVLDLDSLKNQPDTPIKTAFEEMIKENGEITLSNKKQIIPITNSTNKSQATYSVDEQEIAKLVEETVNYLKIYSNNRYITLKPNKLSLTGKYVLKHELSKHENIVFTPSNYDCDRKIIYTFQYVNKEDKINKFSDLCYFRFIPYKLVDAIYKIWNKYPKIFTTNVIDVFWVLDFLNRRFKQEQTIEIPGSQFKIMGFYKPDFCLKELFDLKLLNLIDLDIYQTVNKIKLTITATNKFSQSTNLFENIEESLINSELFKQKCKELNITDYIINDSNNTETVEENNQENVEVINNESINKEPNNDFFFLNKKANSTNKSQQENTNVELSKEDTTVNPEEVLTDNSSYNEDDYIEDVDEITLLKSKISILQRTNIDLLLKLNKTRKLLNKDNTIDISQCINNNMALLTDQVLDSLNKLNTENMSVDLKLIISTCKKEIISALVNTETEFLKSLK